MMQKRATPTQVNNHNDGYIDRNSNAQSRLQLRK